MNHRQVMDQLVEAWETGNMDKAMSLYAEKCKFRDSLNPEGIVGKEKIREYLVWLNAISPQTTFETLGVDELEGGDEFLVAWRYFVPDGLAGEHPIAVVAGIQYLAFSNGKLVRSECFYDQVPLFAEILLSSRVNVTYSSGLTGCS